MGYTTLVLRKTLKSGPASFSLTFINGDFTNNLWAYNTSIHESEESTELYIDLNPNLKVQDKLSNTYTDARYLSGRAVNDVKFVQIGDATILQGLQQSTNRSEWTLTIELEGPHSLQVRPELQGHTLTLFVVAQN